MTMISNDKFFVYTDDEIESLVESFVKARPFIGADAPINVESILEAEMSAGRYRLKLEPAPGLLKEYSVEAMVIKQNFLTPYLRIVIDEDILNDPSPVRFNMAIAEELAHIELHSSIILSLDEEKDFREIQTHPNWFRIEEDAKKFARALLMPRKMLRDFAMDRIAELRSKSLDTDRVLAAVAASVSTKFNVARSEVDKRFKSTTIQMKAFIQKTLRSNDFSRHSLAPHFLTRQIYFQRAEEN